jgi:hypothetical protein
MRWKEEYLLLLLPHPPCFHDVEKEFKNQLLGFTTDILLSDMDLLKNVSEKGNRVLFHVNQLKRLIAILYLAKNDRKDWESLIDIETERIVSSNCFCKDCYNPFYMKIKNIYVLNKINFLTTPFASQHVKYIPDFAGILPDRGKVNFFH